MEQVPLWVSLTQAGASIFLGASALLVASLSLFWSYRHNFGYGPYVIGKKHWIEKGAGGASPGHNLVVQFEVWNRRKYPISVREITIKFNQTILQTVKDHPEWWKIGGNAFRSNPDFSLDASEHQSHTITLTIDNPERDFLATYGVWIECFDPRLEKTVKAFGQGRVHLPNANKITWI